jgi:hypothetical protein
VAALRLFLGPLLCLLLRFSRALVVRALAFKMRVQVEYAGAIQRRELRCTISRHRK